MNTSQQKLLTAIKQHPGLLWYEVGAKAYPRSTKTRRDIFGNLFTDLVGAGLSATYKWIGTLERLKLVRISKEYRYFPIEQPQDNGDIAWR